MPRRLLRRFAFSCWLLVLSSSDGYGQGSVSSTQFRPFVTGIVPIVSSDGDFVGGVQVDALGAVSRAAVADKKILPAAREVLRGDARARLRIISLNRVQEAVQNLVATNQPIPEELFYLAGMQRVEYVVVLPEQHDIVLAGPGESWRLEQDSAVGLSSGQPALRLDDLLEAFRTAEIAAEGRGISCSIDPSDEGVERLAELLGTRNLTFNARSTRNLQKAIGPQQVSVTGVFADSHFARVMVSADYMMKRLAMGLEKSPLREFPSYVELLKESAAAVNHLKSPRWWMAVDYEPLLHSADRLAFQIRGPGVKVLSEDAFISAAGERVAVAESDELAERWAQTISERYDELARVVPVFGELRGCMDLAVTAALIQHYKLFARVKNDFPLLTGRARVRGPVYYAATTVDSQISAARAGSGWVVAVSGGVDIDSWSVLEKSQPANVAPPIGALPADRWWWE